MGSPPSLPPGSGIWRRPHTITCLSHQLPLGGQWLQPGGELPWPVTLRLTWDFEGPRTALLVTEASDGLRLGSKPWSWCRAGTPSHQTTWRHFQALLSTDSSTYRPEPSCGAQSARLPCRLRVLESGLRGTRGLGGGQPSSWGPSLRSPLPPFVSALAETVGGSHLVAEDTPSPGCC